jgi:hypothetical protein
LRGSHLTRLTPFGDDLATHYSIAALHQEFTRMGIGGDVTAGVPNQDQISIVLEFTSGIGDYAILGRLVGVGPVDNDGFATVLATTIVCLTIPIQDRHRLSDLRLIKT